MLVSQIKTLKHKTDHIDPRQLARFGKWMARRGGMIFFWIARAFTEQLIAITQDFIAQNSNRLSLSLNANPVELAALITAFAATLFVIIFTFRTEKTEYSVSAA